jgi:hypothetical protein
LLLFALALTLGLSTSPGDKLFFLILVDRLCIGPLLVILGAFIGLAGFWDPCTKSKLLFSLLSEVFGIRDAVILGLRFSCRQGLELFTIPIDRSIRTVLDQCLLLISLGDALTSLLIRKLSIAFIRTPTMSSLLLGITDVSLGKCGFIWKARELLHYTSATMSVKVTTTAGSATASCASSPVTVGARSTIISSSVGMAVLAKSIISGLSAVAVGTCIPITESYEENQCTVFND